MYYVYGSGYSASIVLNEQYDIWYYVYLDF
jgi:hypothetical protein